MSRVARKASTVVLEHFGTMHSSTERPEFDHRPPNQPAQKPAACSGGCRVGGGGCPDTGHGTGSIGRPLALASALETLLVAVAASRSPPADLEGGSQGVLNRTEELHRIGGGGGGG